MSVSSNVELTDIQFGDVGKTAGMQPISRRMFLVGSVAVVLAACSSDTKSDPTTPSSAPNTDPTSSEPAGTDPPPTDAPTTTLPRVELSGNPFTLGVASGDPDSSSVVIWTRLAPDPLEVGGGMPSQDVEITWQVSSDPSFGGVEQTGNVITSPDHAHTAHVVITAGPGDFYYRFVVNDFFSPIGTTRIAPDASASTETLTFAAATCQDYQDGFYAAHRDIAERKPDFVLWLGDYIYEGGAATVAPGGAVRSHNAPEVKSLDDYRARYGLYKSDPHLQAAHHVAPWFVIWDDHEVENNYAGIIPQDSADTVGFADRRFGAYQAWWEHTPTRLDPPTGPSDDYRIYRAVQWGDLLGLTLLDGRQYRSDQACGDEALNTDPACPEVTAPGRTMLGEAQQQFLFDSLGSQGTVWNAVGNQTVFSDATLGAAVLNYDQWDGYPEERNAIMQHLLDNAIPNVVILTGDIHLAAVGQLRAPDHGTGTPVGIEFISTSISSTGLIDDSLTDVLKQFPALVDAELAHRGYTMHTVTPQTWTAEFRTVDDITLDDSPLTTYGTFVSDAGSNTVRAA